VLFPTYAMFLKASKNTTREDSFVSLGRGSGFTVIASENHVSLIYLIKNMVETPIL